MDSEDHSPLLTGESRRLSPAKKGILISLILIAFVATISLSAVKPSGPHSFFISHSSHEFAPPLIKLKHPVVIMISAGGFGFDFKLNPKYIIPNIMSLIEGGTEADQGMIPCFPTKSLPNLYSIATGLYPENHGIVNDEFPDPENVVEIKYEWFTENSVNPKWWLGEPMWVTVTKQKLKAMTYFWPGSDVKKDPWKCPPADCKVYDNKKPVSVEQMVNDVLKYFDSCVGEDDEPCDDDIPVLFNVYFDQPDLAGLYFGLDSDEIARNITIVDDAIGTLIRGLRERRIYEEVNIILVSDQGMTSRDDEERAISLENIMENTNIQRLPQDWLAIESYLPLLGIQTPKGTSMKLIDEAVSIMNSALDKVEVRNGAKMTVYSKWSLPDRLYYNSGNGNDRIPSIIGLVDLGYVARVNSSAKPRKGGTHGYDNGYSAMRSTFIGHGPRFRKGHTVASFENINVYNLVMDILGIKGAINQGSWNLSDSVLLPLPPAMAPVPAPAPAMSPVPASGAFF